MNWFHLNDQRSRPVQPVIRARSWPLTSKGQGRCDWKFCKHNIHQEYPVGFFLTNLLFWIQHLNQLNLRGQRSMPSVKRGSRNKSLVFTFPIQSNFCSYSPYIYIAQYSSVSLPNSSEDILFLLICSALFTSLRLITASLLFLYFYYIVLHYIISDCLLHMSLFW